MTKKPAPWQTALPAIFGVLVMAVSAWLFATVPGHRAEGRAYLAAPACPAGARADDCRQVVPATVESVEREVRGKGARYWLHVTEGGAEDAAGVQRLRMREPGPVVDSVRPGDAVTLTHWRGEVRAVTFDGITEDTRANPLDDWRMPLGIGLALLTVGLVLVWAGWYYRFRRPTAPKGRRALLPGAVMLAGMLVGTVGFFAGLAGDGVPGALLITACGIPPSAAVGALCMWLVWRRLRRAADTRDVVPVPATKRRTVRASVSGDVPYSVSGHHLLVVGDGRPATTPDPAGRCARVTLPETLTVEGVRGFRLGEDPDSWLQAYTYAGVAIECRDGDKPVLIAARRQDASLILDALTTTRT
ncbi:hypothetical protein [Streptomyces poriticola]|uniref:hypothetical protein n=1 Tax=Streptomyces poriticola TaxID=3120506 RepID=UPI002FCE3A74